MNQKLKIFIDELLYTDFFDENNNFINNDIVDLFFSLNAFTKEEVISKQFVGVYICPVSKVFLIKEEKKYTLFTVNNSLSSHSLDDMFKKLLEVAYLLTDYDYLKLKQLQKKIEGF